MVALHQWKILSLRLSSYHKFLCKERQSFIWLKYHGIWCAQLWLINDSDANILLISRSMGEHTIFSKIIFDSGKMLIQVSEKTWNKQNFLKWSYLACTNGLPDCLCGKTVEMWFLCDGSWGHLHPQLCYNTFLSRYFLMMSITSVWPRVCWTTQPLHVCLNLQGIFLHSDLQSSANIRCKHQHQWASLVKSKQANK